jgi:hypothetical protein
MIYLMPIDECPNCGARTPRIFSHHCPSQKENGRVHATATAELQSWIAAQASARPSRLEPSTRPPLELREAIQAEPTLSNSAKSHLIGLVEELSRAA